MHLFYRNFGFYTMKSGKESDFTNEKTTRTERTIRGYG